VKWGELVAISGAKAAVSLALGWFGVDEDEGNSARLSDRFDHA